MKQTADKNFSVYLDNSRAGDLRAYSFDHPVEVIVAENPGEIFPAFARLQRYLADGYYAAGWISYEVGLFLEDRLDISGYSSGAMGFLSLGIYRDRSVINSVDNEAHWAGMSERGDYALGEMRLNISRDEYGAALEKIADYLIAGDIYQVNFTLKALFDFTGSPASWFAAMRRAQRVEYGAFITTDNLSVLSLSPELFFRKTGNRITARPMKGTYRRGHTLAEDQHNGHFLQNDDKNRAENLMIVDLLRNDLAKISCPGSVRVKSLYDVEKYRTLFQMTSTIESQVSDDVDIIDLITALFPCGSVTGAPKIRAMEIISQLEKTPRGIYTGAIGYMTPEGDCCFSVPIRTIIIDRKKGQGEMGIGSGIVADSGASEEYGECLLKARFATGKFRDFDLIESLLWTADKGCHLLDLHLGRLGESADYFDFCFDEKQILSDLQSHADFLAPDRGWKIRLLLSPRGEISLTSSPVEKPSPGHRRWITLSEKNVDSDDVMIYHKTSDREFYQQALSHHQGKYGSYDVIFVNERGELTSGSFNNIFLKKGGHLYTPPLDCGLLNGVLRQSLMKDCTVKLTEKRLTVADLGNAEKIYMGNSVRGLVEVSFKAL